MIRMYLLFIASLFTFALSVNAQTASKAYILTNEEKIICDTLGIDTNIVRSIRELNRNIIEPFHYSLSKVCKNGTEIDADPIFLNGLVFSEESAKSYDLVFALKDKFKTQGYTIFVLNANFNINGKPDDIGVLKTTDKYTVLKEIKIDAINYGIENDSLISIIKGFDKKYSLELIGASGDWCEFIINRQPKNWMDLANEVYKVCPDVVEQGTNTVLALAEEMKKTKRLYLWWD